MERDQIALLFEKNTGILNNKEGEYSEQPELNFQKVQMILDLLGKPIESEEEKKRYLEALEKEQKRKERFQENKNQKQREWSLRADKKIEKQNTNLKKIMQLEESEKGNFLGKQRGVQNKTRQMKERKKKQHFLELVEHNLGKEEVLSLQQTRLISFIENDIINTILFNVWKIIEEKNNNKIDYGKMIGSKKHNDQDSEIITYISRGVQTVLTWHYIGELNVSVGFESKPFNPRIRKRFIEDYLCRGH